MRIRKLYSLQRKTPDGWQYWSIDHYTKEELLSTNSNTFGPGSRAEIYEAARYWKARLPQHKFRTVCVYRGP